MYSRRIPAGLLTVLGLIIAGEASAQGSQASGSATEQASSAGPTATRQEPIYVQDLQVTDTQNESGGGLISRLRASRQEQKVAKSASELSAAIVRELNNQGIPAHRLTAQDPPPHSGWLVTGVFAENAPHGVLSSLSSLGSSAPNTQVSIAVLNLASDPSAPEAHVDTAAQLKGQGSSAAWNPYAVAARFVVNQIESSSSVDALARKIVAQILTQRS